jgi:hypothetical protein
VSLGDSQKSPYFQAAVTRPGIDPKPEPSTLKQMEG